MLIKLVLQGNTKVLATGVTADWSSQTVKFKAHCVGNITVRVRMTVGSDIYFKVIVDGNRVTGEFKPVLVDKAGEIHEFTFNVGNKAAVREIQIARITEVTGGATEIMGVEFGGELHEAEESTTLIEFIGDSITCGTGGGGEGVSDGTRTYAFMSAQNLGFDFRIRSRSGSRFGGTGLGHSWPETYVVDSYVRSETTPYSHTRNADVVCIYLGTNDNAANQTKPTNERNAYFVDGMKNFITIVKEYNPDAKFVWITGGMTNGYKDAAITAMNDLGGESAGYYVCQLPDGLTAGGTGHPTYEQHAQMADVLGEFLTEKGLVK
jgi:lysophospholipase L1-like esterase